MRDVVTKQRCLSLAGCKPRISPANLWGIWGWMTSQSITDKSGIQQSVPNPEGRIFCENWPWWPLIIPPQRSWGGVYWIHPVRPSVCLSVCLSVRPSVGLGQDLAWDWISASYLIKYAHTGRSCDLLIFGIPEVNFLVRAFQFGMKGVLSRIYDISPGFCWIPIFVFFLNFLRVS